LVTLLKDAGPTHSKSGPPEILCNHSCLPNYTAYTNHWGLAHLSPDQNIFGGTCYYCYKNSYSRLTNSLHITTFINKKVMQPAHIWIIDHVGHDRKNLDGSNSEKVLHHIVSCEQQPSQESRIGSTFLALTLT